VSICRSGNIRVYCRIRPFLPGEGQKSITIEYVGDNGELIIGNPTRQGREGSKSFKFNKVLGPTASQGTNKNATGAVFPAF
jgi:kinesin family member C2/C3